MKERNSNIELLRIICMIFIIGGHLIMYHEGGAIVGSTGYYISNIMRSFFMCAVNTFVLISGYFGVKFNVKKLIKLDINTITYSVGIFIIMVLLGIHQVDIKKDILLFIPVVTKRYWFISIYFVLCIISPILNKFIDYIEEYKLKTVIIVMISLFYVLPTILYSINAPTITEDSGYGIINFICLYIIGRYIKCYKVNHKKKSLYLGIYLLAVGSLFLSNHVLSKLLGFYFNAFISYDTVFNLLAAYGLFMLFLNINIKSKLINILSQYSLAVYIIHMQPTVSKYLFVDLLKINSFQGLRYIISICIIPIIIYLSCWCIEFIRVKLFNKIEDKAINIIFNKFSLKVIEEKITLI